jgi:hypothetical protein
MKLGVDGKFVDSALAVRTLIVYISRWGGDDFPHDLLPSLRAEVRSPCNGLHILLICWSTQYTL